MNTKTSFHSFLLASLLLTYGSEPALAGPFDKSGVGASGVGLMDKAPLGLTMGIIFDTTIPPPGSSAETSRSHHQVEALRTLVRDHLKVGDFLFIESVTRGYNGWFIAQAGGGEGVWAGGLLLPLIRIGTTEQASSTVWTKDTLLNWVDRLEQLEDHNAPAVDHECPDVPGGRNCNTKPNDDDNTIIDWDDSTSGRPSMQGAIYMARHMFKSASSLQRGVAYKPVLFIFSDGHFVGSSNPAIRNPHALGGPEIETPPIGDWHIPVNDDFRNSQGVAYRADRMSPCTADQAHNGYASAVKGLYYYQCFDYWNNTHRTNLAPLPADIATSAGFENHIALRMSTDPSQHYGFRSLYYDALCGNQGSANALAAEQADLARSQEGVAAIVGFIPKYGHSTRVDRQELVSMQRLTWDKDLPACWLRAGAQSIFPCETGVGLMSWRFHKTFKADGSLDVDLGKIGAGENGTANRCGGYGEYHADGNVWKAGEVINQNARRQMIWTSPDFDGLDEVLERATNDQRGVRLTIPKPVHLEGD